MFIGHAATGFAARRLAPRAPLPWLLAVLWSAWVERVRPAHAIAP